MQLIDGKPVYSATDLVGFLECEHLTNLDRAALAKLVAKPERHDDQLELIAHRGLVHEHRYLETLKAQGLEVVEIERDGSRTHAGEELRAAAAATEQAMRAGADVLYQATFFDGTWRGHADFLHRIPEPSDLGAWSYAVADTKLARRTKASALLQMCVYSDLLTKVQGRQPPWMEVALGGSARAIERFRVDDHMAYYRRARDRFLACVASGPAAYPVTVTYPEPVEHCEVCRWAPACAGQRRKDDHLSYVAGITKRQRVALGEVGIHRLTDLAVMPLPVRPAVKGLNDDPTERIREQARLQREAKAAGTVLFEMLQPIEAKRGLALLPQPSAGDLFFDIEGDPFVEESGSDGLEYLFGVAEVGEAGSKPPFHALWGTDRASEKVAFEAFVDLVMDRWTADPDMHVYHYGDYEPSRVRKLMGLHATREEEVDQLLRGDRFVNLYRVIQQGVRVSQESYSIKKLEPLYGLAREVSLQDAGSSIVRFEQWLDSGRTRQDLLDLIEAYNEDDCVSNRDLRDWLEQRRGVLIAGGHDVPRPQPEDPTASPAVTERQAAVDALVQRLEEGLPATDRGPEQQARWLLAQLIDWHRREAKATWWRFFDVCDMTEEELLADREAIASVTYEGVTGQEKQSLIHRYRFPPQENRVRDGAEVRDPATGKSVGKVKAIDQVEGWFELPRGKNQPPYELAAIFPFTFVPSTDQQQALMDVGAWVADHGIDAPGPWRAARDLLLCRPPRVGSVPGSALRRDDEAGLDAAIRLGLSLDHTVLAIQGPPGSGKTYTGSNMIVELVRAGKRVGISANSHKVIGNLLDAVLTAAKERGVSLAVGQKPGSSGEPTCEGATPYDTNDAFADALEHGDVQVAGGTAWVWAASRLRDAVDVLFIDEAGQLSLANTVAISGCAKSLVLLGDPRQLEQPIQGSHPPGAERSALEHLLGEHQTIPDDLGLFLPDTRRLSPAICDFTSEVFYEDRLGPWLDPSGAWDQGRQRVTGDGPLSGAGIRWVGVQHEGNVNDSDEEVEAIQHICDELLRRSWVDPKGIERPIDWSQILVVAPYNAQVAKLAHRLGQPGRVGTVDKFQGREAAVSLYSLTTSSADLAPRGMDFLYSANRLNVATSRARALAIVVGNPALLDVVAHSPTQMRLANALCRLVEVAAP